MSRRSRVLAVLALLLFAACAGGETFEARVVRVIDGDSIRVQRSGGQTVEIRLIGIDAPERRQPHAGESLDSLRRLLQGCTLAVHGKKRDLHGRLLARAVCNGKDAGLHQIASGMAWAYPKERSLPSDWRRRYAAAEKLARRERRGLWSAANPVPPWEARREGRRLDAMGVP